jgi:hypothetical protein
MVEHEASRTLVKSPPELWAECSDASSLERHLGQFGEIRITRLEPETAVAWEGAHASGTVRLEPSGWGTRVIITAARVTDDEPEPPAAEVEPPAELEPAPAPPSPIPLPERRGGLLARIVGFFRSPSPPAFRFDPPPPPPEPAVSTAPEPEPEPESKSEPDRPDPAEVLAAALDSLGQAHHRPFSRG